MRVATYNIHHGAPARADRADHLALVAACRDLDADLIGLQEVDRRTVRSYGRNQARLVGQRLDLHTVFGASRRFGATGATGNAVCSRWPIDHVEVFPLSATYSALIVTTGPPGQPVTVANMHLVANAPGAARAQLARALMALLHRPLPWLVMGDFNLHPHDGTSALERFGLTRVPTAPTLPVDAPVAAFDWIAVRGLDVMSHAVLDVRASDHRPVVAELAFRC